MAGSVNKVILIGNVGAEPDIRATQDGREIANLSIATSERWNDKASGERREKTEWHRVAVFNPGLVTVIKNYVHKGSKLYIEGQLQTRKWTDQSGMDRYTTEIVLQSYSGTLTMLDSKQAGQGYGGGYNAPNAQSPDPSAALGADNNVPSGDFAKEDIDDEIPF